MPRLLHSLTSACLASTLALGLALGCTSQDSSQPEANAPGSAAGGAQAEPAEPLPDGVELLAAHVEAAGGADAIAKFESVHTEGVVDTGQQRLSGTMQMWWKKGGKFYLEQDVEGVGQSRAGYDGETIWIDDPITGLRVLEGEEAASYIQTSMMFPAHDWRLHFDEARTIGKATVDGGEVWEVELVSSKGPNVVVGLDASTKLLRTMRTTQITPMGPLPIEATSDDYETHEGYKFSMTKRSSIKSLLELEEKVTKFEVNVPIDDAMFAYPSEREQVPADPAEQPPVEPNPPKK